MIALKFGEYVFRFYNKNILYLLGVWLREKGYDWRKPRYQRT